MTTKPASSRWIAIFSSIILLILCFLTAETWRSRPSVGDQQRGVKLSGESPSLGHYVQVEQPSRWFKSGRGVGFDDGHGPREAPAASVGVNKERCVDPTDLSDIGGDVAAVPASVAPAVADRVDVVTVIRDAPLRPFGHNRSVTSRRPLRRPARESGPQVPSRPRTVSRSLDPPSAKEQLRRWPYPENVVEQLRRLVDSSLAGEWAARTIELIDRLYGCDDNDDRLSFYYLAELERQVDRAVDLVDPADSRQTWSDVMRARYALHRRVELWRMVQEVHTGDFVWANGDEQQLRNSLQNLSTLLADSPNRVGWKDYLLFDEMSRLWQDAPTNTDDRCRTARLVLERLANPKLNGAQTAFLRKPVFQSLTYQLQSWATEPIDYQELLGIAEEYETDPTAHGARKLADGIQKLRWSNNEVAESLAEHLELNYRNANARVSISAELIHRLLPTQGPERRRVDEKILGAPVMGSSVNEQDLYIQLLPDQRNIQLGVVARGIIKSQTYSDVGPVRLHNKGLTRFEATQLLILDRDGFRLPSPQSSAKGKSTLTDVESDLDLVPILGSLVRTFAAQQHDEARHDAKREMESKVARRAACELHQTISKKLDEAESKLHQRLVTPLNRLELDPVAIDLQTTDRRIVARYRLAGDDQLAAHTPRPIAPSDSWLSVQLHESSLNNALSHLQLGGERISITELYRRVVVNTTGVRPTEEQLPMDLPDDVFVIFDSDDPIRVRLDEGRIHLQLRIVELENSRNWWSDFVVSTTYAPTTEQGVPAVKRDSIIDLDGDFNTFERVGLRAIFNAVFPKNNVVPLIGKEVRDDPRLTQLTINQFVIIDGWLGIALHGNNFPRQAAGLGLGEFIR